MVKLSPQEIAIRQHIVRRLVEDGYAPSVTEIASSFGTEPTAIKNTLRQLAGNKGAVLHPHSDEVWVLHPFSNGPNAVWVEDKTSGRGWWSNCPWCAFGIAALLKRDVTIHAKLGAERDTVEIPVVDGRPRSDLMIHFPIAVPRLWDNVLFSCSTILCFKDETEIDAWCSRHRLPKGGVLTARKCWDLAQGWYGPILDGDWNRKSPKEVERYFSGLGLGLDFKPLDRP